MKPTRILLLIAAVLLPLRAFADSSDDFNDNSKDTTKWGDDVVDAGSLGALIEQNQRLEFVVNSALTDGNIHRPWKVKRFPVNADWTVQVDVFNSTTPGAFPAVNSAGFSLFHPETTESEIYIEVYAVQGGKGIGLELDKNGSTVSNDSTPATLPSTMGAVRMEYNSATRVVTCSYDTDISNGYQFTQGASYGLDGAGGTTANTDWNLTTDQQFSVWVYGFAEFMAVPSGQLYLDNFMETGGVAPSGSPSPVPVGHFSFGFPTNNPLLIAIASIFGNYSGSVPQADRPYTLDVAQDEAGKLMTIGTVDGVTDSTGSPQMASEVGAVATVDGKPTVESKTAFNFIADGQSGSCKGANTFPLEFVDIGGGSNGLVGTVTGSANAFGMPLTFKNTPIAAPETPDMQANFRKNWILEIDISQKAVKGKQLTVATALLTLPNGDVISYPEKKVKYSTKKGYKLALKKGTNTTVDPNRLDKKSSIKIQGMTFTQQGADWVPTGGTIDYRFLGQRGTANLLDFTGP